MASIGDYVLLLALVACCTVAYSNTLSASERSKIISEAIQQVKDYEHKVKINSLERKKSQVQKKLHGFKMATPTSRANGKANLKFERIVKAAERMILKKQREAIAQDSLTKAESLALEILHRPGKLLTTQELARIYSESGCREAVTVAPRTCSQLRSRFFRRPDGTCNNLRRPTLGAADTGARRLIGARYDDGVYRPKGFLQSQGSSLFPGPFAAPNPSPRLVSTGIILDEPINDTVHTHILMQWGQFLDHDLDLIPEHEPEECPEGCAITEEQEGSCYPIPVPLGDTNVLSRMTPSSTRRCEPFQRSFAVCTPEDKLVNLGHIPPKEQINAVTHFIDGSMVYHHNPTVQRNLIRDTSSNAGLLRVGTPVKDTTQPRLPFIDTVANPGIVACMNPPCFLAGDLRVNEQLSLSVMHTIWVREHNRIARRLKAINPTWKGEKIFLTAQKIVGAMIQKITYRDFLPEILGNMSGLVPPYIRYNSSIDPSIPNAFATAAYRFGHSLIQPAFDRLDENYASISAGPLGLIDAFFNSTRLEESQGTDPLVRGLLKKNARKVDEFLNNILTTRLFADDADTPGLDLASLNVQRGRDHGLPNYLRWKNWAKRTCGIESEFRSELTKIRLLQTYGSLNDVDLFVGGLAEQAIPGGLVGATFACIFGQTFTAVRDGDRFYYENTRTPGRLTNQQIREIEKASLSRVICDTSDNIKMVQKNAFLSGQPRVPCDSLDSVNLDAWKSSGSLCSIRVLSDTAGTIEVVSRVNRKIHLSLRRVSANQETCAQFLCPSDTSRIAMSFLPRTTSCTFTPNNNLPPSRTANFYSAVISRSLVQPNNGLHFNQGNCNSGSTVGMRVTCGGSPSSVEIQSSNEEVEVDVDDVSEIVPSVGEENMDLLDSLNSGDTGGAGSEKKLISLMENVLAELQRSNDQDTEEGEKSKKAEAMGGERSAMAQLEEYFKSN